MKILLSIKPEFVKEIFSGKKKFEYRKSIFTNKKVTSVIVYSTMPVGKIVGEFTIETVLVDKPQILWKKTSEYSGISKKFFDEYFAGRDQAYAIKIGTLLPYDNPINPYEKWNSFVPPQSFRYIDDLVDDPELEFASYNIPEMV
ncbi:ASCH domain-containing protein [uncultured Parabacteroides sp.]|uniref:ASCH domain-containing protein n=1 Tax=uncultured Parabacteroides sp. TaxID=512312 RepID=UPI00258C25D0|nr:ASCH domain-containing protein [uncultured Parabacteroides sp.]